MIFGKTEARVERIMREHTALVGKCLSHLERVVEQYLAGEEAFVETSYHLHKAEHEADEVRRDIQREISAGAFLPFYRSDYISLVEQIDKVANRAVDFSKAVVVERPRFPKDLHANVQSLAREVVGTFAPLEKAALALFSDAEQAVAFAKEVSAAEQETDSIEWKLLKSAFSHKEIDRAEQIYLRDSIHRLAGIADQAENAADQVRVIIAKQKT